MSPARPRGLRALGRYVVELSVYGTLVALFMWPVLPYPFYQVLTTSQCIGFCILAVSLPFDNLRRRGGWFRQVSFVTVPVGGLAGVMLAGLILRGSAVALLDNADRQLVVILSSAIVFGSVATYWFHSRDELAAQRALLRDQALRQAQTEQRLTEANLKLLQAQMEPHFLFNTLSNVQGLLETRPPDAGRMLANLTAYLRASLRRTRAGATSLGDEIELVRAYLEIQAVRMGPRLRFGIDVPPQLLDVPLPPLLLQPIVENAVRHGLEHRPEGGEIRVRVHAADGTLVLEVSDTGIGLHGGAAAGLGLANVRERLRGIYGPEAAVEIRPNEPEGLWVRLLVPGVAVEHRAS